MAGGRNRHRAGGQCDARDRFLMSLIADLSWLNSRIDGGRTIAAAAHDEELLTPKRLLQIC